MPRITRRPAPLALRNGKALVIQNAFRRRLKKAGVTAPPKKKGIYRNVSSNILTIKCRVPFAIRYDETIPQAANQVQDGSRHFNFLHAPWKNLDVTTINRLYNADFVAALQLYQMYRLARVDYTIRRPKQWLSTGSTAIAPTESCGSEVLHTYLGNAVDTTTSEIQSTSAILPRINTNMPTTWQEGVDNQSSRFHIHGYKTHFKRTWLPSTPFEKKFRNKELAQDQELAFGGLHLRIKNAAIVPNAAGTPANAQIMFEGFADVYMNYSRRT